MFVVSMKASKKKLVIILAAILIVLAGALFFLLRGGSDEAKAVGQTGEYSLTAASRIIGHIIKLPDCVQTGRCLRISNKFLFQQGVCNDGVGNRVGKTKVLTVLCSLFHHRFRQDFFGKGLRHFQPTFLCADDLVNAHGDLPAGDDVSPNIRIRASITHTFSLHLPHKAYRL